MPTVNEKGDSPVTNFQRPPLPRLGCLTPGCAAFKHPPHAEFAYWDTDQPHAPLRCPHCHKDRTPSALFQGQGNWKNPLYGFGIALFSGTIVWFLPHKLLPWSQLTKSIMTGLCAMTLVSIIGQLWRRQKRLYAHDLLGLLGEPANLPTPPEASDHLQSQLQGKVASLDGALKAQLLSLLEELHKHAFPTLVKVEYANAQRAHTPIAQLRAAQAKASLTPEEASWVSARIDWLQRAAEDTKTRDQDVTTLRDLFDGIADQLESLKYGDHSEKEEARRALKESIEDGNALLKRLQDSGLS